jgi:predicted nucleotidyltransferase
MRATGLQLGQAAAGQEVCSFGVAHDRVGQESRGDRLELKYDRSATSCTRQLKSTLQIVDRSPAPSLLPILRSQQQGEILALLLGDPDRELSLTEISHLTGAPHASVYREIQRAEQVGLVTSRKIGNTRLVRADRASPYYAGLADVLTKAFGVPAVLADALRHVAGIDQAYVYGSWAARHSGEPGRRPVGDIDVLVLGEPDRDQLYEAVNAAERRLGREVQATVRESAWLSTGSGSFHETITGRPMVKLALGID